MCHPDRITVEEFLRRFGDDHAELIAGVPRRLSPHFARHGAAVSSVVYHIGKHLDRLGDRSVCTVGSFVSVPPDTVYEPDFAYFAGVTNADADAWEYLPAVPPALVVEVLDDQATPPPLADRVADYLSAGVRVVLLVDPDADTVTVGRRGRPHAVLDTTNTLTLPDVLPGFAVPVAEFFS